MIKNRELSYGSYTNGVKTLNYLKTVFRIPRKYRRNILPVLYA